MSQMIAPACKRTLVLWAETFPWVMKGQEGFEIQQRHLFFDDRLFEKQSLLKQGYLVCKNQMSSERKNCLAK